MEEILKQIKVLLKKTTKKIIYIPFEVKSYTSVIEIWKNYKNFKKINLSLKEIQKRILYNIFSFHLEHENHVLLYYSNNQKDCLMLCKINGKYINIKAPIDPIKDIEKSFIAVYC
jgi:hypothetical protein